jgi:HD-GYP domain-containing protein (c-di-GMP phosphodiesterase class II)
VTGSQSPEGWEPVQIPQLRVGHYIKIDHRWFDHPFVRRMFQITTEKELETIREVELTRIFVNPGQSTVDPPPADSGAAPVEEDAAAQAASREQAVAADVKAQREGLAAAQARQRETLERAQYVYAALGYGDPNSAAALDEFVDYLVALLNNSTSPLALMANSVQGHSAQRFPLLGSDAVSMAAVIGKRMGLSRESLRELTRAAAAHVLGLSRLPANMVDEETEGAPPRSPVYRSYPVLGATVLEQCGGFSVDVVRIVREHRERPDGRGFPQGLAGEAIHPHALILGAVREFQIRCSGGRSQVAALAYLNKHLRPVFGAEIIGHLALSVLMYPAGSHVQLSDGRMARVLRSEEVQRVSPVVEVFRDVNNLRDSETIDLSQRRDLSILRVLDTSRLPPRMFTHGKRSTAPPAPAEAPSTAPAPETAPEAASPKEPGSDAGA